MDYNGYGNTGFMKKCIMSIIVINITMITYLRPSVFKCLARMNKDYIHYMLKPK